jgi:hypothetical protein
MPVPAQSCQLMGPDKVQTISKLNETESIETKRNQSKQNRSKRNGTKTKWTQRKLNQSKRNKTNRNETYQNDITQIAICIKTKNALILQQFKNK